MDQNRIKQISDKTDIRSWVIHFFCRVLGVGKEQLNLHILVGSGFLLKPIFSLTTLKNTDFN